MSKILVQGRDIEVTESLENHVQEQFSKALAHFEALVVETVEVTLKVESNVNTASVHVPVAGNDIQIAENGEDMYQVITSLAHKATRKLRKIKEKANQKSGLDKRQQPE